MVAGDGGIRLSEGIPKWSPYTHLQLRKQRNVKTRKQRLEAALIETEKRARAAQAQLEATMGVVRNGLDPNASPSDKYGHVEVAVQHLGLLCRLNNGPPTSLMIQLRQFVHKCMKEPLCDQDKELAAEAEVNPKAINNEWLV